MSFYLYFRADNLSSVLNGGILMKKHFVAIFLRFHSFWCIKNYFCQLSEYFGWSKTMLLCSKQGSYFHLLSSTLIGAPPSPLRKIVYGWSLTDSEVFILFADQILFKIYFIPVLLTFMSLVALFQKTKM